MLPDRVNSLCRDHPLSQGLDPRGQKLSFEILLFPLTTENNIYFVPDFKTKGCDPKKSVTANHAPSSVFHFAESFLAI